MNVRTFCEFLLREAARESQLANSRSEEQFQSISHINLIS